jgi:hypothetical protein
MVPAGIALLSTDRDHDRKRHPLLDDLMLCSSPLR